MVTASGSGTYYNNNKITIINNITPPIKKLMNKHQNMK